MTPGWVAFAVIAVPMLFWAASIWNRPTHRIVPCDDNCGCGHPHQREALATDAFYAMSGLWILFGWKSTKPTELEPQRKRR